MPDYPFWALLLRWDLMIRISNSSMVNFDKNSLSTVYWIGSFFSKLYRPPCFSYLFSTYANRLIQYTCLHCFFLNNQMALASSTGLSPFPFWWVNRVIRVYHYSDIQVMATTFPTVVHRSLAWSLTCFPSFRGSWRSSLSARCISNVSDYCIQLSKNTRLYLPVYENPLSEIMDFHRLTSGAEGKGKILRPSEWLDYDNLKVCNHIHDRRLYSAF